jgi:hypothetical protein
MKDCSNELIKAVYNALTGQIKVGESDYPVYSVPPKSDSYNYVLINSPQLTFAGTKDFYAVDCDLSIETVGGGATSQTSYVIVNEVGSQITNILVKNYLSMSGFTMIVSPFLDGVHTMEELTGANVIIHKTLRFKLSIQEN